MEKRLPIALLLSVLVLFGWSLLMRRLSPPVEMPPAPASAPAVPGAEPGTEGAAPSAPVAPKPEGEVLAAPEEETRTLDVGGETAGAPGRFRALFSNRGARLLDLRFRDYFTHVDLTDEEQTKPENWLALLQPLAPVGVDGKPLAVGSLLFSTQPSSEELAPGGLTDVLWEMEELRDAESGAVQGVAFRYGPGTGIVFHKRVTFEPGTWRVHLELALENTGRAVANDGERREFRLIPAGFVPPELGDKFYPEPRAVAIGHDVGDRRDEIDTYSAPTAKEDKEFNVPRPYVLAGVHNKYFAFLLREEGKPEDASLLLPRFRVGTETHDGQPRKLVQVEVPLSLRLPAAGTSPAQGYTIYAGPKRRGPFVDDFTPHELVLDADLGSAMTSAIGNGLLVVLRLFHGVTGNWGVAIILLTLLVRLALFPLNRRSQTAMARYQKKMKRVQPKLEELKKRFANDPKKLREAQGRLMQEERAFPPLGGCLPMFLQLPVFFGLFSALRTSFDLRQAPFALWIHDLSRPDQLLELNLHWPILPDIQYLNVLPIAMVVLWILQQRGMPQPADEQAARMQKMMMFMPILFGVFLYGYAAGLSLYMMTTSTLSIFEQKVIKKVWPVDDTEVEPKKRGCGPFAGMFEHLAQKSRAQMEKNKAMQAEQRRAAEKRRRKR